MPTLVNRLVFVGGGVTELLITDAAGRKPRATKDLDCIIEVASGVNYHSVEKILRDSGFSHDKGDPPVICRWLRGELILDVMPTIGGIIGPSNIWYPEAIANPLPYRLGPQLSVSIISPVYFIATKTEAFKSRGNSDYRGSRAAGFRQDVRWSIQSISLHHRRHCGPVRESHFAGYREDFRLSTMT